MENGVGSDPRDAGARGKRKWPSDGEDPPLRPSQDASSLPDDPAARNPFDDGATLDRKRTKILGSFNGTATAHGHRIVLRHKLTLTDLPHEILQHIFSFVDPLSLGRLLCVNRSFHALLDPAKSLPRGSRGLVKHLTMRNQDLIWATSRKSFLPGLPRPMDSMTEVDMWRLVRGRSCQFCGKRPKTHEPLLGTSPWSRGPGPEGVRTIWPFRVRSCAGCLEPRIVKDTEMLFSTSSALMPGLPFAIFTPSLNYISSATLSQLQLPPRLQLTKYYFRPQVQDFEAKLREARALGESAAEGWFRGLEAASQEHMADDSRFEQWELHYDLAGRGSGDIGAPLVSNTSDPSVVGPASTGLLSGQPGLSLSRHWSPREPARVGSLLTPSFPPGPLPPMPLQQISPAPGQQQVALPRGSTVNLPSLPGRFLPGSSLPPPPQPKRGYQRPRVERSLHEVEQTKAERRKDIERRCLELNPPIKPSTLTYMEAFNAAIKIPMPLNENAWELLKTRLLTQRADAEQRESDQLASLRGSEMEIEERRRYEEERKQVQQNADRMWTVLKKPSREKIKIYAEEHIRHAWGDGHGVTKDTSSRFAADVLCYVRARFFEVIALEDRMLASQGRIFPPDADSMASRKLKLEDMKWVFEECVKPHTEPYGKELFLCSACDVNHKHFSLDAVIQHYAAKHTNALSHGNSVLYWKADWPADPPFDPNPHLPRSQEGLVRMSSSPAYTAGHRSGSSAPQSWTPVVPPGQPNGIYHVQSDELVSQACRIWDDIEGIRDLTDSVRLYVIIQHLARGFKRRFTNEPTLSLFTDCVNNKDKLRPLKSLSKLRCKACSISTTMLTNGGPDVEYQLPDLLKHFQKSHIEVDCSTTDRSASQSTPLTMRSSTHVPRLDWKHDMVALPIGAAIHDLLYSPGMDQSKLQIIAEVLPQHFPQPLPPIRPIPYVSDHDASSVLPRPDSESMRDDENRPIVIMTTTTTSNNTTTRRLPFVAERGMISADDEYDPRHPAPAPAPTSAPSLPDPTVWRRRPDGSQSIGSSSSRERGPHHSGRHVEPRAVTSSAYSHDHAAGHQFVEEDDYGARDVLYKREIPPHLYHGSRHRTMGEDTSSQISRSGSAMEWTPRGTKIVSLEPDPEVPPVRTIDERARGLLDPNFNAAEHFLDNFDAIATEAFGESDAAAANPGEYALGRPALTESDSRPPLDDRREGQAAGWHDHHPFSRDPRTRRSLSPLARYERVVKVHYDDPAGGHDRPYALRGRPHGEPRFASADLDYETNLRERPYSATGEHDTPSSLDTRRHPRERYRHDDGRYSAEPEYGHRVAQRSPDFYQPRFDDRVVRYVEVLPSGERRYVGEPKYIDGAYEPVEYIRVVPREFRTTTRGPFMERPLRDYAPEYVDYNRTYLPSESYESERPPYSRAPDSRDGIFERYEAYERYEQR